MARKSLVLLVIISVLIFVVGGCAPKAAPPVQQPAVERIVWKDAEYTPPTSIATQTVKWFLDEVVARSDGRFEVRYFWSGSLCPATEQPDGLKARLFEATSFAAAYYKSKMPLYSIGTFPCLFPFENDTKEEWLSFLHIMNEWLRTPALAEEFGKWDARLVAANYPVGYNSILANVRFNDLEGLKGKKIRASGTLIDLLNEAGAAPVYLVQPEVYESLSKGVIEGAAWFWILSPYRIQEAAKYMVTGLNLGQVPYGLFVNTKAYEALPSDIKEIFEEVNKETFDFILDFWGEKKLEIMKQIAESGLETIEFSPTDKKKLEEMSRDLLRSYVDKLEEQGLKAKEAYNSLQDIIKKHVPDFEPYYL